MDTTTHALAGYMIAKTGIGRDTGKWGTIAGVAAAVSPDIDLVLGFLGTEFSLKYHRGLTNSVFLIIPFSFLLAWVFVKISKMRRFWTFFFIGVVEMLVHTFFDVMGSYGTMILSPFSNGRFSLDWVFIVDFFLVQDLVGFYQAGNVSSKSSAANINANGVELNSFAPGVFSFNVSRGGTINEIDIA